MEGAALERNLAIGYAPAQDRAALQALFALDAQLGSILRSTREPLIGQMRLTWWHDALVGLDEGPPPAEPILRQLAGELLPRGVTGAALASMVDGWEALLGEPLGEEEVDRFAAERGGALFGIAAQLLGASDPMLRMAGEGWALADLAANVAAPPVAERARLLATERLDAAFQRRWSSPARPLGALALLARADLRGTPPGSPRRVGRLLRHRLTGR